ncbi:hypothetical protein NQ502_16555 [Ruminococcus gauvreauii]|uniref:Uncharacterized protein n=2 Tax=Ruminococcus gauvreauii TaxID=438033 RepID=A0ABY5VLE3_9FIRM|nr:hypothetical protein [Ruminococcus gauvreauii]UWP61439.1 hypothetical protein NQ502_16555 [Ruminococcus gauvreauii]
MICMKRILAVIGVVLILSMYGATMFFAVTDSPDSAGWFKASVFCTVAVPVLLYAYTLVYRYLKNNRDSSDKKEHGE